MSLHCVCVRGVQGVHVDSKYKVLIFFIFKLLFFFFCICFQGKKRSEGCLSVQIYKCYGSTKCSVQNSSNYLLKVFKVLKIRSVSKWMCCSVFKVLKYFHFTPFLPAWTYLYILVKYMNFYLRVY